MAYRDDHTGTARGLCGGFVPAAFKTAIEAEPRPRFGELAAATAIGHFTTLEPASTRETIDRISVGGRLSSRRIARHPQCRDGSLCVALSAILESVIEGSLSLLTSGRRLVERCAAVMANSSARRPGQCSH